MRSYRRFSHKKRHGDFRYNEKPDSYYQISCQFKFRNLDNKKRIVEVLLDLIMEAKRKRESEPLDSILLYTDDNIIGQAIHDYMIDRARRITTLNFQDIVKGICAHHRRDGHYQYHSQRYLCGHHGRITQHSTKAPDALRAAGADCKKRALQPVSGTD